jgi:N-carbamoyl-L-amino-acid hydrolase
VGEELERIGYLGSSPCPGPSPAAFIELHIEQGPILENEGCTIGVVTGVQGISWQEVTITGQSNHAGTTPMTMRHDPSYVAAAITVFLRDLSRRYSGHQVCTVGKIDLHPNLINVIPARAILTLDVRNTDEEVLKAAETEIRDFLEDLAVQEGVAITTRSLARFEPVTFDDAVIETIERVAHDLDSSHMRLPSGAGHDAQMFARVCPSGMIFVPSINGISHNPAEDTSSADLEMGANVLLHTMLALTESMSS